MTATFTSDFREEYEAERARWLRKRFLWYAAVVIALGVIGIAALALPLLDIGVRVQGEVSEEGRQAVIDAMKRTAWVNLALNAALTLLYIWSFLFVRARYVSRETVIRLVYWLIVVTGVVAFLTSILSIEIIGAAFERAGGRAGQMRSLVGVGALWNIFWTHFFASLFLPWTPRESIRPIIPLLIINAIITVVYATNWFGAVLVIALSPLTAGPGMLICSWRYGRFRDRFHYSMLRGRYSEMKRELTDARRIHEALFPSPVKEGPIHVDYRYEPMRQIGGDYLHIRFSPSERGPQPALSVVIVDVTGHGIPAALTVNRLHGELERLFAENPDASPGFILERLNSYVHLTLASHSVYVTALCVRVDPNTGAEGRDGGVLEWASGGHPPAFVRAVDGSLHQLDSTAFVLGATHGDDFQHCQSHMPFAPGDVLLAYTDGATEARDRTGKMLRVEGLQRVIAAARLDKEGSLAEVVLRAVDEHRFGSPADDTLIVEISRPLRSQQVGAPRTNAVGARA